MDFDVRYEFDGFWFLIFGGAIDGDEIRVSSKYCGYSCDLNPIACILLMYWIFATIMWSKSCAGFLSSLPLELIHVASSCFSSILFPLLFVKDLRDWAIF